MRPSLLTPAARSCREHFLAFFPDGFRDESYVQTERSYKWDAHREWVELLNRKTFESLLDVRGFDEIARRGLRIESHTNLLFSFEKMALRDALRDPVGARTFATGLHGWIYGSDRERERFERWTEQVAALPAAPDPSADVADRDGVRLHCSAARVHMFLKPTVTRIAADAYEFDFEYRSTPQWETYSSLLDFARRIRGDQADLGPRDMIDAQSFIWTQGSAEYE